MKLTFTDQVNIAKEISGFVDASNVIKFKRDINRGGTIFMAALGREYNRKSRTTNLVAAQQYYQLPEDAHRLKEIIVNTGSWFNPLEQIPDEFAWRRMNMFSMTGQPTHYFIRGYDEVGLYPIPSASVTNGIELVFSPRHLELTEDDTTSTSSSSTITVAQNSTTVTSSGTIFTPVMAGQWLEVTDGTDDDWYRINSVTTNASLELENYYQGASGAGKTFRIGQVMDMPEEYLESPVDYAMHRHFLRRGSTKSRYTIGQADEFKAFFDTSIEAAKDAYGQTTENQVITAEPEYRQFNPFRGDPPASISA